MIFLVLGTSLLLLLPNGVFAWSLVIVLLMAEGFSKAYGQTH